MGKKISIIIMGVNYFGLMAPAGRIRNLIAPLLNTSELSVSNFIINAQEFESDSSKIEIKKMTIDSKNMQDIKSCLNFFSEKLQVSLEMLKKV